MILTFSISTPSLRAAAVALLWVGVIYRSFSAIALRNSNMNQLTVRAVSP